MTELDGGGHEERPGSGIPARGTPNPAAHPPAPGGPGFDPSDATASSNDATASSNPEGTAWSGTGPGTASSELRGRHVLYDGWTPPSDDPLFGGPRSYAFSFDHLRSVAPGPDPAPATGQHPAAAPPAVDQAGPGRYERPAARPGPAPGLPGSAEQVDRPASVPTGRDDEARPDAYGSGDAASSSASQPAAPDPPRSGWAIRGWPAEDGQVTGATPMTWPNTAGATGSLPSPAGLSRTGPLPTGGRFGADGPSPRYPSVRPGVSVRPGERERVDEAYGDEAYGDEAYDDEADAVDPRAEDEPDAGRGRPGFAEDRWDDPADTGPDRARQPRRVLAVVAGAVLLLVAAVAAVTLRGGDDQGGSPPASTATSLAPIPANFLDSTTTDSDRISVKEFFPDSPVTVDGRGYRRLARRLDDGCPQLTGDLTKQFAPPHCGQAVRALFLSTPAAGTRAVLVGVTVFSLDTATTATTGVQTLNQGRGGITPLPIPAGAIQNAQITGPGGNNSWRSALSRGHYLIYTQVAYVDGTTGAGTDPPLRSAQTDVGILATEPIGDRAVLGHGPRG
ncbi:hypothetical protein [Frankia sp. AgKG'84/4]